MKSHPAVEIILQSFLFPVRNAGVFASIAALPTACAILIASAGVTAGYIYSTPEIAELITEIVIAIQGLLLITFLVSWHRFILIGRDAARRRPMQVVGKRDFRFILYGCLAVLGILVCTLIFLFGVQIIWGLVRLVETWIREGVGQGKFSFGLEYEEIIALIPLYFTCHWLMVLPAVASDEADPFSKSKELSHGSRLPIFLVIVVVFAASTVVEQVLSGIVEKLFFDGGEVNSGTSPKTAGSRISVAGLISDQFLTLIYFLIGLMGSAIFASALSHAYKRFSKNITTDEATPSAPA